MTDLAFLLVTAALVVASVAVRAAVASGRFDNLPRPPHID